jgi:L-fuconate dehydratase
VIDRGRYRAPAAPGFSTELKPESIARFGYPNGPAWR